MENYFKVECPKCRHILIIDRITGEVMEVREPLDEEGTGDRFADSLQKVKAGTKAAEEKFLKSKEAEKSKARDLDALFQKSLEQVKKEGPVEKQIKGIDLE